MNLKNVAHREVLDFDSFRKKVHDYNYKPLSPENQTGEGLSKSGLSQIKREPAYDHVGYADAVFAGTSKIDVPGVRFSLSKGGGVADATGYGITSIVNTSESVAHNFQLKRISDF